MKKALITGITGQDGSYLAELLLGMGYEVHGLRRRSSSFNTGRIDHIYQDEHVEDCRFKLHYGDLADASSLIRVLAKVQPDEVYHLGAQSHVDVSFENPEYTADSTALGTLRLLEAIRVLGLDCRFYQASTSELYGSTEPPQDEKSPFRPRSPYASAKLYAHSCATNYREAYGMHISCGILFNHESPRRGETFVTRKITRGLARIKVGTQKHIYLGNLNAARDWGHARDYAYAMWLMLQQDEPDDYVIATGKAYSVRQFVKEAALALDMDILWQGEGLEEVGYGRRDRKSNYQPMILIDKNYYRPAEVDYLLGDPTKAKEKLGWVASTPFRQLVREMVGHDYQQASSEIRPGA